MGQNVSAFSDLTAAVLVGGLGTRLLPVVADRPKALAEIHGRPFLQYLLDQLSTAGCSRVVLCTGYLGEQIEEAVADGRGDVRQLTCDVTEGVHSPFD